MDGLGGAGDLQSFSGEPGNGTSYDGSLRAGHVGVDAGNERWLAGASIARHAGAADYRFGTSNVAGNLQATLTSVQPYLRWAPRRGTEVWVIAGTGSGAVEVMRGNTRLRPETSELAMRMAVVGARQVLASPGRIKLALRGNVGMVRITTGAGADVIDELAANVQRYRVGLETSHTTQWANGATLAPFAEIAGRSDGGDGETGNGLEARGRVLALHTATGYREHGLGVTARLTPGGTDGRGLLLMVTPGWGAPVAGADALWREQAFGPEGRGAFANDAPSVDAQVGYSFAVRAGHVLTPFSNVGVHGAEYRRLRVGLRLGRPAAMAAPLRLELAGERHETGWERVDNRLGALGALSF